MPPGFEGQHGAAIEVGITLQGLGEGAPGLGKGRRVQDDQVKGSFLEGSQEKEDLFLVKRQIFSRSLRAALSPSQIDTLAMIDRPRLPRVLLPWPLKGPMLRCNRKGRALSSA